MPEIRLGIVGVGNCASALVQGLAYCTEMGEDAVGVLHHDLAGYRPQDITIAAAFDIDRRKVGEDVAAAIWRQPNCTKPFWHAVPETGTTVRMGRTLDGIAAHMTNGADGVHYEPASAAEPTKDEVVGALRDAGTDVVINFLPVGSRQATEFYAECALDAGAGLVNGIPVFLASDAEWSGRFAARGLPIVGDDFKSQLGATAVHRALVNLFRLRGARVDRTYQLNVGGNTDFRTMLDPERLPQKRLSKTEAVKAMVGRPLDDHDVRIGPSDFVPWLDDNKVAYIRIEGSSFGGIPIDVEVRLSVEDSPNAAAVAIDAIRCAKIGLDRGTGGSLGGPSAFLCKHPPENVCDEDALAMMLDFVAAAPRIRASH